MSEPTALSAETVTLTDAERTILHAGVCARHRDDVPGVYVCGPCEQAGDTAVEQIIAVRVARATTEARAETEALREQVEAHMQRMTLFADGRMRINEPPSDDAFNRGIRTAVDDLHRALSLPADTPEDPS